MYKTIAAIMWWWGYCEKDAWNYSLTADPQMIKNIVSAYENQ